MRYNLQEKLNGNFYVCFPWTNILRILSCLLIMGYSTWFCCTVTEVSVCHINIYIYLVNWTLLYEEDIPQLSRVRPFCCVRLLWWLPPFKFVQVWLAAEIPRPPQRRVNGNDPLACRMCLTYLRSMCIQQKNHNPPLTQSVTNTDIYLDFLRSGILMLCLAIEYQFKSNQNLL
jgi:hypothetical protein